MSAIYKTLGTLDGKDNENEQKWNEDDTLFFGKIDSGGSLILSANFLPITKHIGYSKRELVLTQHQTKMLYELFEEANHSWGWDRNPTE
jgi:hypothetical protein